MRKPKYAAIDVHLSFPIHPKEGYLALTEFNFPYASRTTPKINSLSLSFFSDEHPSARPGHALTCTTRDRRAGYVGTPDQPTPNPHRIEALSADHRLLQEFFDPLLLLLLCFGRLAGAKNQLCCSSELRSGGEFSCKVMEIHIASDKFRQFPASANELQRATYGT